MTNQPTMTRFEIMQHVPRERQVIAYCKKKGLDYSTIENDFDKLAPIVSELH